MTSLHEHAPQRAGFGVMAVIEQKAQGSDRDRSPSR
jgi:hypothetical protein